MELHHSPANPTGKHGIVFGQVLRDRSDKQIAHELEIAVQTVRSHFSSIQQKLGTHSRVGLALLMGSDQRDINS